MTHDIVTRINRDTSLTAMAHLTCAAHTRAELTDIVSRYGDAGIANILALRGDPPKELDLPPGDLGHATDLVDLVREVGDFSVGVAVHPEGHPGVDRPRGRPPAPGGEACAPPTSASPSSSSSPTCGSSSSATYASTE